jgi:hypothetical protein
MPLEEENTKLNKLLADQMLDNAILSDVAAKMVSPDACRDLMADIYAELGENQPRTFLCSAC